MWRLKGDFAMNKTQRIVIGASFGILISFLVLFRKPITFCVSTFISGRYTTRDLPNMKFTLLKSATLRQSHENSYHKKFKTSLVVSESRFVDTTTINIPELTKISPIRFYKRDFWGAVEQVWVCKTVDSNLTSDNFLLFDYQLVDYFSIEDIRTLLSADEIKDIISIPYRVIVKDTSYSN